MIKLPAYFLGFNSKSDGSAGLRFGTQETRDEDFANFKRHQNAFGWLLFDEQDIAEEDIPRDLPDDTSKSPAARLRAVMYVYFKETSKKMNLKEAIFETFYRTEMERHIEYYKSKLPPR